MTETLREQAAAAVQEERAREAALEIARRAEAGKRLSAQLLRRFGVAAVAKLERVTVEGITFEYLDDGSTHGRVLMVFKCKKCGHECETVNIADLYELGMQLEHPMERMPRHSCEVVLAKKLLNKATKTPKHKRKS